MELKIIDTVWSVKMYHLIFCETLTGIILNENFTRYEKGQIQYCPKFNDELLALAKKNELLKKFELGECTITNIKTKKSITYKNEIALELYLLEQKTFNSWMKLSWYLKVFKKKPSLKYF
jgi:hypothetical protein